VISDEFSVASGELTPSLKLRRRAVEQKYQDQIEALYHEEHVPERVVMQ
jgi:long-chain acyl-CoA synthetase